MSIRRWLGLDFVDLLIHLGVTIAVGVIAVELNPAREEIATAVTIGASLVLLGIRRQRGLRRLDGAPGTAVTELQTRVAELEDLLATGGDSLNTRLAEVEGRLDFAERLLARQTDVARLPGAGGQ